MKTIGILGGGQLALFLANAAKKIGYSPIVLAENEDSPAKQAADVLVVGALNNPSDLNSLFSKTKVVIFENEWIDTSLLEKESQNKISFFPDLSLMRKLQDKLLQKEELTRLEIPTLPFIVLDPSSSLQPQIEKISNQFKGSFVLKWSRNGYDGKGILLVSSAGNSSTKIESFCQNGFERQAQIYAEPLVQFERELALIACRSMTGEFISYPLVISVQEEGTCKWILNQEKNFKVSPILEAQAINYAQKLANELNIVGTFAIEFFLTLDGKLFVNEISPRVHNSGHYTIEASSCSQFENHLRAVLGLPLISPQNKKFFGMLNLLGPEEIHLENLEGYQPKSSPDIFVHWYGKKTLSPRRKMGHVTFFASNEKEREEKIKAVQLFEKNWKKEMEERDERQKN